ncbi:mediator of RNA polymerase II transcription subunit 12 isoform X1 [Stomoxys calcitrans]|uniref:mediator of RNA polymerase II transcription subunit 12 isoform X1 n=1 Tax=Stomoxys calcitrans TaxID=35570 RepID=UPI0027E36755|nr:mediator of RNA polymerase II transcription subunit 12 isoform X1 [Stomoxys calcitrans]
MATLASEMPPLHTAEALAGVQTPANASQPPPTAVASVGVGGGTNTGAGSGGGGDPSDPSEVANSGPQAPTTASNSNNTISAAADSSDNQPSTPQPTHHSNGSAVSDMQNHHHQQQHSSSAGASHHPYANHHMYASQQQPSTTTASSSAASSTHMQQMYPHNIYASANMDMQQQPQTPSQHSGYPSYLNSYEQFYQQQQQQQHPSSQNPQMDYINSNSNSQSSMYPSANDYKQQAAGVRYHPYLHTPTSGLPSSAGPQQNSNSNNALDAVNSQSAPVVSSASSSVMSPRVVSSTSPSSSSNQMQMSGSASSIGSMSAGNPSSPASGGSNGAPQCKKCGIMCTNDSELQEHIANVHGASPYASSGYASSPYIKEELQQQQTPPSQNQQQQSAQQSTGGGTGGGGNPGEILDLDSQKMLYPPGGQGLMPGGMMHPSVGVTDPLQSMHSMQQRAGMASWDQQSTEGLPPYLQQNSNDGKSMPNHSPYYPSAKESPYHVSNSSNVIKSEYPMIKSEYPGGDTQQYMGDKSFDPTAPGQQQMMPPAVSSSPAEFPSTTTGGPQDTGNSQQGNGQFRGANFEPPSSSSALSTNLGTKAANWKSNEARRPKTYNCTACNKWFTSSGHLKRHYNTTLHKNAVKSSGQPDPATLPISAHHHPAREPTAKTSRRGGGAAAAAAAAAANAAALQQPPNPVIPPEPPNSPQDYGGPQTAAGGLTPMSHYAATPSPNSMYHQQQQQQQYQQYMPQVQSTTNASPQHASNMAGAQQPSSLHAPQTVMNGHPNALAGPSVPMTQTMPMPSSQMRGLLNNNNTTTTTLIIKNEHMEAAMEDPDLQDQDLEEDEALEEEEVEEPAGVVGHMDPQQQPLQHRRLLLLPKEEYVKEELEHSMHSAMEGADQEAVEAADREAPAHNVALHHMQSQHQLHYQLEQQQADMERLYHNTTPSSTHSNMQVHSPLIISHQQYREQLELEQQIVAQGTYTLTPTPPPLQQQQLHHNIMEPQPYISMPLAINTQQHSSMLQLQQQHITTEQQQPQPDTTIPTSMANMLPPSHLMPPQQQPTELQPLASTQLQPQQQLDTINTNTQHMLQSHITTSSITNIPSYHQLQQPGSVLQQLDHTLTYPHTIIGNNNSAGGPLSMANAEILTLDAYGNLVSASATHQQLIQTADGQLVQLIPANSATGGGATTLYSQSVYNPYIAQRSPQEGDLPPISHQYQEQTTTLTVVAPSMAYSPSITSSSNSMDHKPFKYSMTEDYLNNNYSNHTAISEHQDVILQQTKLESDESQDMQQQQLQQQQQQLEKEEAQARKKPEVSTATKRKRNPSSSSSTGAAAPPVTMLPSGRIKCIPCGKEFTKICYLTQHNKSFHSGEYPFRCQKCGKRYQSEDVYITHLGKHKTTDKAHKCDMCPKQFHHKTDLRRHIEAIHTGNKQHSCDICEKSFCRKDHLRKHLETHSRPRMVSKKSRNATNSAATTTTTSGGAATATTTTGGIRSIAKAFAKIEKKSKDSPLLLNAPTASCASPPPAMQSSLAAGNAAMHAGGKRQQQQQQAKHLLNIKCENSCSPSASPVSMQNHHLADDVAVDDDELLDEDDYDLDEEEYISIEQYEQEIHQRQQQQQRELQQQEQQQQSLQQQLMENGGQFALGKQQQHQQQQQAYQIIEQEIPSY